MKKKWYGEQFLAVSKVLVSQHPVAPVSQNCLDTGAFESGSVPKERHCVKLDNHRKVGKCK